MTLQLDWYPQPEHGGFFTAALQGYYKAEGLDVTLSACCRSMAAWPSLLPTGKADFGLGSSDQILEWDSNGLPLIAVAATMQHDPQAIMVHQNSPVHDFKDLEGHTIAAQTGATWLKYVISRYNLHNVREDPVDAFHRELSGRSRLRAADLHHQRAVFRQAGRSARCAHF